LKRVILLEDAPHVWTILWDTPLAWIVILLCVVLPSVNPWNMLK
jgi:hypothetical protein